MAANRALTLVYPPVRITAEVVLLTACFEFECGKTRPADDALGRAMVRLRSRLPKLIAAELRRARGAGKANKE